MKKLLLGLMGLLSESLRLRIYRSLKVVPNEYLSADFRVEIASTQEDLQSAFALLHDSYVEIGILDPQPSGLRCNQFSFLPTTSIIVAKYKGRVVGTISAIKDSRSGLPSDGDFLEENNLFRRHGKSLAEVSAMAVASEFRGNHAVTFLLIKFVYNHCRRYFECDHIIATSHPRTKDFVKALMGFEINGKPTTYSSLKRAAAIHISLDLSEAHLQKFTNAYRSKNPMRNLGALFQSHDNRFHYAKKAEGLQIRPVITPDILNYFCLQQKEVWSRLEFKEKRAVLQFYSTYFGDACIRNLSKSSGFLPPEKDYRTAVQLKAKIAFSKSKGFCHVLDLSSGGCYVSSQGPLPRPGERIEVAFRFRNQDYRIHGQVAWLNESQSLRHPRGMGILFYQEISFLNQELRRWTYGESAQEVQFKIKMA